MYNFSSYTMIKTKLNFNIILSHLILFTIILFSCAVSKKLYDKVYKINKLYEKEKISDVTGTSDLNFDPFNVDKLRSPLVINSWNYKAANAKAWESLSAGKSLIDSIVDGISVCDFHPHSCDDKVRFGDNIDENGDVTSDAILMDGNSLNVGGVAGIKNIINAIGVSKHVLQNTKHSLLVGEQATEFGKKFGFKEELPKNYKSLLKILKLKIEKPLRMNYWVNVSSDVVSLCRQHKSFVSKIPKNFGIIYYYNKFYAMKNEEKKFEQQNKCIQKICSSLEAINVAKDARRDSIKNKNLRLKNDNELKYYLKLNDCFKIPKSFGKDKFISNKTESNHNNIGMIVLNDKGEIAAGSSSHGFYNQIPGHGGALAIPGSAVYADSKVGAAIMTGNEDIIHRLLPSFIAVEEMQFGANPSEAVFTVMSRILGFDSDFQGAIIVVNKSGTYAAACSGMEKFSFSVTNNIINETRVFWISCLLY